ncbi:iron chaperone [Sinomicrobium sp. M5D2P9]
MAKTNYQSIDQYHQVFGGESLARMQTIRKIIHEVVPGAEESISYQIPCFKYKGYLIYYCAFPKHISLSHPYSDAFWKYFKADLVGYKTSKSVIRIPTDKPLPEKLIKEIITFRKKENEEMKKGSNT